MKHISKINNRTYDITESVVFENGEIKRDDKTIIWYGDTIVGWHYGGYDFNTAESYIKDYLKGNYENIILLKDNDSKYYDTDLIILTNETKETIENEIDDIRYQWHENDCDYSLLEAISDELHEKFNCICYYNPEEIYY